MRCPDCGGVAHVTTTLSRPDGTHRWLRCCECKHGFRTREQLFTADARRRGVASPTAILTEDDVTALREAHAQGVSQRELSRIYGICKSHVFDIVHRHAWTHI